MYMVISKSGDFYYGTYVSAKFARRRHAELVGLTWAECAKRGDRPVRVDITERVKPVSDAVLKAEREYRSAIARYERAYTTEMAARERWAKASCDKAIAQATKDNLAQRLHRMRASVTR